MTSLSARKAGETVVNFSALGLRGAIRICGYNLAKLNAYILGNTDC